jgi:hypothetical protein
MDRKQERGDLLAYRRAQHRRNWRGKRMSYKVRPFPDDVIGQIIHFAYADVAREFWKKGCW